MMAGAVMTDRAGIEQLVRNAYAARVRGNIDEIMPLFDPDAHFELAGEKTASPVPMRVLGADNVRAQLAELIRTFKFHSHEIVTMAIDGSKVAVRGRIRITSAITGQTVDTELADFIEVKDGRIVSLVQFCDTALVGKLLTK
jgi:ketosteroid isomerase-like protein